MSAPGFVSKEQRLSPMSWLMEPKIHGAADCSVEQKALGLARQIKNRSICGTKSPSWSEGNLHIYLRKIL